MSDIRKLIQDLKDPELKLTTFLDLKYDLNIFMDLGLRAS
ncbi:hypothetical protein EYZ11_004660 [Aspergillus tanneri]|uniref:Uncharacterized protein n=1 Tax=Aspergillus tanneri TaxID=1220188 RepID=A0A4S3JKC2_9EURO|nr:hypothetical protein EYZ11_004660 [Aspergillus tanneri]